MKEKIVKFMKGPFPKKYTAIVKDKKTKKTRKSILVIEDILTSRTSVIPHHKKKKKTQLQDGENNLEK
jgi:hypothetical protein